MLRLLLLASATCLIGAGCAVPGVDRHEPTIGLAGSAPGRLTLVSWNAQKGQHARFDRDLSRLLARERPDLLFLQEARHDFRKPAQRLALFGSSWRYPWPGGATVGVLTFSTLPVIRAASKRSARRELLVTAPKTSLISEHLLADGSRLLAANVHLLNFERFRARGLAGQLDALETELREHEGPVVVAGDFNVWSRERLWLAEGMADRLDLDEVRDFPAGRRTGDLGALWTKLAGIDPELPLDRVYSRGLELLGADVLDYDSSDHAPIRVRFELLEVDDSQREPVVGS